MILVGIVCNSVPWQPILYKTILVIREVIAYNKLQITLQGLQITSLIGIHHVITKFNYYALYIFITFPNQNILANTKPLYVMSVNRGSYKICETMK